jgi:hypothetical protein
LTVGYDNVLVFMSHAVRPTLGEKHHATPLRSEFWIARFVYVPAVATDIEKTFARVRREQRAKAKAAEARLCTSKVFVLSDKQAMR